MLLTLSRRGCVRFVNTSGKRLASGKGLSFDGGHDMCPHLACNRSRSECAADLLGYVVRDLVEPAWVTGLEFVAERCTLAERECEGAGVVSFALFASISWLC
jgi:hypothetical protein